MRPGLPFFIACALSMCACAPTIAFKPLVVEPIHVTVDVTIHDEPTVAKPTGPTSATGDE